MKRERYIPQGFKQFTPEIGEYPKDLFACYTSTEMPHKPMAIFYVGKRSEYAWYHSFSDVEAMKKHIISHIKRLMSWEDMKAERKEKRKIEKAQFIQELKVGDIFCHSWGYEQTNIDFYQVTAIMGKKFELTPIASKSVEGSTMSHGMADYVVPAKDQFLADSQIKEKMVKGSLSMPYGCLFKTTETEKHYRSWYA